MSASNARQHQHLERVDPEGPDGVDLLVHLHGADLRREGAARAAGDHDRGDEHAHLAQHGDADQVDHIDLAAELAQLIDALVGDHDADQDSRMPTMAWHRARAARYGSQAR
jgi:hypothetical protein